MPSQRRFHRVRPSPGSGEERGSSAASGRADGVPLGKLLLDAKAVERKALEEALATQRKTFLPLGRILRDEHGLEAEVLSKALRRQTHTPRVFLRFFPVDVSVIALLEPKFCQEFEAIAFEQLGGLLCVALANPGQRDLARKIETEAGMEIKLFQAPWEDIKKKLKPGA